VQVTASSIIENTQNKFELINSARSPMIQYFIIPQNLLVHNFSITGAGTWGIMAKPRRVYASQRTK
jgi:hypothetical protein